LRGLIWGFFRSYIRLLFREINLRFGLLNGALLYRLFLRLLIPFWNCCWFMFGVLTLAVVDAPLLLWSLNLRRWNVFFCQRVFLDYNIGCKLFLEILQIEVLLLVVWSPFLNTFTWAARLGIGFGSSRNWSLHYCNIIFVFKASGFARSKRRLIVRRCSDNETLLSSLADTSIGII